MPGKSDNVAPHIQYTVPEIFVLSKQGTDKNQHARVGRRDDDYVNYAI